MKYITNTDLKNIIRDDMLTSSIQGQTEMLNELEANAIGKVKAYLFGLYKLDLIFDGESVLRNPLLVEIIAKLVTYAAVRRNAARKVPADYSDLEDQAYSLLQRVADGKMTLIDLPVVTNEDGTEKLMWGNSKKTENYV